MQNIELQIADEIEAMINADKQAKEIRVTLDKAQLSLERVIKEARIEISGSMIPGFNGKIPFVETIIQSSKNVIEIYAAYEEYLGVWQQLQQAIDDQNYYALRVKEKETEIEAIKNQMSNSGCAS